MGRSPGFKGVVRALRLARRCADLRISAREGLERAAEARRSWQPTRRDLLKGAGISAGFLGIPRIAAAGKPVPSVSVGIVGAGMAGMACADTLAGAGVAATVYEARDRVGGRVWSLPDFFPSQVAERGGELIDTLHITMKGYAQQLGLDLQELPREWLPGETAYYFGGQHVSEEEVVDEFRDLVDAMRPDMAQLSAEVTAEYHSDFDEEIDFTDLRTYLETRGAGPVAKAAIDVAYNIEYGCEIELQSALNFLFFIHIDKRSRFRPFGVFSDERYHVIGGNQQIPEGIAARLPGPVEHGRRLLAVSRRADGTIDLSFEGGATAHHDAVVLTLPAPALRQVDLSGLDLDPDKQYVIDNIVYGANAKLNVGMTQRIWGAFGSQGDSYSDQADHQNTWEPDPIEATPTRAILLDYSGGDRAAGMNPNNPQQEASRWLDAVDNIWPGAKAAARKVGNKYLAHLQHWPSDPFTLGAYTCNHPGYFTTIAGLEAEPAGNVYFAGEHTDSFYEWQGFMEGAANSGIRAAEQLLADFG